MLAEDRPHALVLLDLNGFKTYNDSYGHGAGDMLLQRLGAALGAAVGAGGDAYRMGGDEFCVLAPLPATSATFSAQLRRRARHPRRRVLDHRRPRRRAAAGRGAGRLDVVLALADARMYRQKNAGRPPAARSRPTC